MSQFALVSSKRRGPYRCCEDVDKLPSLGQNRQHIIVTREQKLICEFDVLPMVGHLGRRDDDLCWAALVSMRDTKLC